MCLPKTFLTNVLGLVGLSLLASGIFFIWASQAYINNEALLNLTKEAGGNSSSLKYVVYGLGSFLIVFGIFELLACATRKSCCIIMVIIVITLSSKYSQLRY